MGDLKFSEQFEAIIQRQLESGRYDSVSEVVQAGLSLLDGFEKIDIDEFAALRASINDAFDDGSADLSIEEAFGSIERQHARDKTHGQS